MLAEVRAGKSLTDVAGARQLPTNDVPALPRGMAIPDAKANEAFFSVPHPAGGKPSVGKVVLADGRIVVFAIDKVTPGDTAQATQEQRDALARQLATLAGNEDVEGVVKLLRQRARVEVAEDRL